MWPLLLASLALAAPHSILITVDDLPIGSGAFHKVPADREAVTRGLLAALARHHITAVGLVVGANHPTPADERLLELWLDAGHELGNHSFSHLDYSTQGVSAYVQDVERERVWLEAFLRRHGRNLRFFRYPFLDEGDTLEKLRSMREYLKSSGQASLPVTIDNQDWSFEEPWITAERSGDAFALRTLASDYLAALRLHVTHFEAMSTALFRRAVPEILLLHANAVGAANWDGLFDWLEQSGHRFARVDEVLDDPAFGTPPEYVGRNGLSLWDRIRVEQRMAEVPVRIRALVAEQVATWNRGDIEAFVAYYAEDCTFVTPDGVTKGRAGVLDRYHKRYPDRAAMGTLAIDVDEIRPFSGDEVSMFGDSVAGKVQAIAVVARWHLAWPSKPEASGKTVILLRPRDESWDIVQDVSM
jgi:uncharacterized protein (TIGR02246 family)